jgi:hypothetical protein
MKIADILAYRRAVMSAISLLHMTFKHTEPQKPAAVQPNGVNDQFCTCPRCSHLASHVILRIEGTATTRKCVNCAGEWILDHTDPSRPVRALSTERLREKLRRCLGCWDAALASEGKPDGVPCTRCGTTWKCKPGFVPPKILFGQDAADQLRACAGCVVAAAKAKARPHHWVECQTCAKPMRYSPPTSEEAR